MDYLLGQACRSRAIILFTDCLTRQWHHLPTHKHLVNKIPTPPSNFVVFRSLTPKFGQTVKLGAISSRAQVEQLMAIRLNLANLWDSNCRKCLKSCFIMLPIFKEELGFWLKSCMVLFADCGVECYGMFGAAESDQRRILSPEPN